MNPFEHERLLAMTSYEQAAYSKGHRMIAGIDEAGRGPLAGPVVAAACILPPNLLIPGINDSKKLTPKKRGELFLLLIKNPLVHYGVGIVDERIIDEINILEATKLAMLQAVNNLEITPDYLLVDGLKLPHPTIPGEKIIKGDTLSQSIAAASIIAKETRDRIMLELHKKYPEYGFDRHSGYGTEMHREAISRIGPCEIHRRTFEPIKSYLMKSVFTSCHG